MALATVDVIRKTGAGPTTTSITSGNTRWSASDDPAPGTNYGVPIPVSGTNYSYWVTTRLSVASNPDGHTLNNIRWFTATNNAPPGLTYTGFEAGTGTAAGYREASGTLGTSGTLLNTTNHTGLDGAPVDVFGLTEASPASLDGTTTSTGEFGDHFVYQAAVDATASPGTMPSETFTWRYDEA